MPFFLALKRYPVTIRLGVFVLILLLLWLPFAVSLYLLLPDQANLVSILTIVILYILFIVLLRFWQQQVYQNSSFRQAYGLRWDSRNFSDCLFGLIIGVTMPILLFITEALFGWVTFQSPTLAILGIVGEGLLVGIGVGLAEELLFRGWLLNELKRDYSLTVATWTSAMIFALLHFIKPLAEIIRTFPQFPGLILLGLILVWGRESRRGYLGLPIGLHGGLVWGYYILNVGGLVEATGVVSPWLTGVDSNPLAGLMGLLFLGGLGMVIRSRKFSQL